MCRPTSGATSFSDERAIRRTAVQWRVPIITTTMTMAMPGYANTLRIMSR